jgi:hypothetical protein
VSFGRRYGWFIEKKGDRIGELDYVRWIHMLNSGMSIAFLGCRPEDAVVGPDAWLAAKLALRNRRSPIL